MYQYIFKYKYHNNLNIHFWPLTWTVPKQRLIIKHLYCWYNLFIWSKDISISINRQVYVYCLNTIFQYSKMYYHIYQDNIFMNTVYVMFNSMLLQHRIKIISTIMCIDKEVYIPVQCMICPLGLKRSFPPATARPCVSRRILNNTHCNIIQYYSVTGRPSLTKW